MELATTQYRTGPIHPSVRHSTHNLDQVRLRLSARLFFSPFAFANQTNPFHSFAWEALISSSYLRWPSTCTKDGSSVSRPQTRPLHHDQTLGPSGGPWYSMKTTQPQLSPCSILRGTWLSVFFQCRAPTCEALKRAGADGSMLDIVFDPVLSLKHRNRGACQPY